MGQPSFASHRNWLLALLLFFAISYALLAVYNHYAFRTYAFDLGLFNQALWDYAHLRPNANSVMRYNNLLGDHLMLLQPLWSPLYWVTGSYTLVLVQLAVMLLGGYGAYRLHLLRSYELQPAAAVAVLAQFLSLWGIFGALAFDYHDNVVAAMLLPWLFYFFEQDRRWATLSVFGLVLLSKENMALWAVFISLGLAWLHWSKPDRRWLALGMAAGAALYTVVALRLIIPFFSEGRAFYHQRNYAALGGTPGEMVRNLLLNPALLFQLLFLNHLPDAPEANGIKLELHAMVLLSGGYALLRRPAYLLMLVPIYAQKLFSSQYVHWGLNQQYSIEFVPVISAALSHWLLTAAPKRAARLSALAAVVTFAATLISLEIRVSKWHDKSASQFYLPRHYRRGFDVAQVHRALATIPPEAMVSASSPLLPHLAFRPFIYCFPDTADANVVVLLRHDNNYPITEEALEQAVARYRRSSTWRVRYDQEPVLIAERIHPYPVPARRYFTRRITDTNAKPGAPPTMQ